MAAPWPSSKVYTKIRREEMAIAADSDPRRKRIGPTRLRAAREMMSSILDRMKRLVRAAVDRSYVSYAHSSDRAISREDLESEVNTGLVYGVHRYDPCGKLEPYNYLNGIIHIVLVNAHIRRNRMKRIPRNMLVSIDTPRWNQDDEGTRLSDYLDEEDGLVSDGSEEGRLLDRFEVENLFSSLEGRTTLVRSTHIPLLNIVKILMDGGNVNSTARELGVSNKVLRRILKREVMPVLEEG